LTLPLATGLLDSVDEDFPHSGSHALIFHHAEFIIHNLNRFSLALRSSVFQGEVGFLALSSPTEQFFVLPEFSGDWKQNILA